MLQISIGRNPRRKRNDVGGGWFWQVGENAPNFASGYADTYEEAWDDAHLARHRLVSGHYGRRTESTVVG